MIRSVDPPAARAPSLCMSRQKAQWLSCDARTLIRLIRLSGSLAVVEFKPDIILNELTDLPDDVNKIAEFGDLNARIRTEGNQNIIDAARASGSPKILAQTVAWELPDGPDARAVRQLESSVLAEGGVVLSYGQLYGPGTYNEDGIPAEPRVQIDRAAERTVELLDAPSGVVTITD